MILERRPFGPRGLDYKLVQLCLALPRFSISPLSAKRFTHNIRSLDVFRGSR